MTHIQYVKGDIFEAKTQIIVNTVNCRGVMGKGLALAFKERYPDMFFVYQQECREGRLRIGRPTLYKQSSPWILNFPTKDNWRANSKLEYIEKGLKYLVKYYKEVNIQSIAFPRLGTQNGKLSWDEVGPLMARYLSQLDIPVHVYIAEGDQEYQASDEKDIKKQLWQKFNEISLLPDQIVKEVQINKRDAQRIADKRSIVAFTSMADIEEIPSIAKITTKRIKDYFIHQQYRENKLIDVSSILTSQTNGKQRTSTVALANKKSRKRNASSTESPIRAMALFD